MRDLQGVHLDFEKMNQTQWELHFKAGELIQNNRLVTLEPAMIELVPGTFQESTIYTVYYNYPHGYYIARPDQNRACVKDLDLGGFLIQGCDIRYFYPDCDPENETKYIRTFDNAFNTGYLPDGTTDICGPICQSFNDDFNIDYQYSCELLKTRCINSLGGASGTAFNLNGYIKIPCTIAKE